MATIEQGSGNGSAVRVMSTKEKSKAGAGRHRTRTGQKGHLRSTPSRKPCDPEAKHGWKVNQIAPFQLLPPEKQSHIETEINPSMSISFNHITLYIFTWFVHKSSDLQAKLFLEKYLNNLFGYPYTVIEFLRQSTNTCVVLRLLNLTPGSVRVLISADDCHAKTLISLQSNIPTPMSRSNTCSTYGQK